ncbi:SDR family oxidoreductase [Spiroplasma eriocheiris]|uniref:D-mannonate oxidoreductase n=1 Tax=Spiroplasma eriocheiris TaxID=315358 RepID=A0A0H3XH05_9MOLU|nr:SDR family oxidoreductase [Spiroplasma eriocheiris]AHF57377.1 D-mannonate oxidoreductase [Spiroplasma eriocheiris CCTCC M 207170]AKM53833.1 D-mannonate oxidoreductase [Spiroplasma eriocheiris]
MAVAINPNLEGKVVVITGAGGNNPRGTTSKEVYEVGDEINKEIQSFFDMEVEGFKFVFDLNFIGKFNTIKVFIKHMLNKEATIINTSSMASFAPMTKVPAYAAAYAAVNNFTKWLAVHFAPSNVRINAIAPGFFLTAQNKSLLQTNDGQWTPRTKKILAATPMNRLGEPKELLGTILWLMDHEASGFVTGVVVPIDGGFQAYSGV